MRAKKLQLETPKEENDIDADVPHTPLRAPKSRLPPCETTSPTNSNGMNRKSLFDNPFKRNSENIGFKANAANVNKEDVKVPTNAAKFNKNDVKVRTNAAKVNKEDVKVQTNAAIVSKEDVKFQTNDIKCKATFSTDRTSTSGASKTTFSERNSGDLRPVTKKFEPTVDPAKMNNVESAMKTLTLQKIKDEPHQVPQLKNSAPVKAVTDVQNVLKFEPWMKPSPIDEKGFVAVVVQYISPDGTVWVMLEKDATASSNMFREINKGISCAPTPDSNEIKVNSLFRVPYEEIYYRGVVLEPVSTTGTVSARLIDYGITVTVPIGQLKSTVPVMRNLNAFGIPIKFDSQRKVNVDDKLKIKMKTIKDDVMIVEEEEGARFTMNDIEVVPLPIPATKKLFCLDYSNVKKGFISTCVHDPKAIELVDWFACKISKYCDGTNESYSPQAEELCLCKFTDNQWYRAVVSKVIDADKFEIVFIDFGNITTESSQNIRKMTREFTHHCLLNKCFIKGQYKKSERIRLSVISQIL